MSGTLLTGFLKRCIVTPVLNLLRQGMTPQKLSVTLALGTVIGVIPAFGTTTVLGTAVAARFRLNIAATVLIGYLMQPLQLLFFIPFIKAGILMFGMKALRLSLDEVVAMFKADWLDALQKLWLANLVAVAAWAVVAVPAAVLLYYLLLPVLKKVLPLVSGKAPVVETIE